MQTEYSYSFSPLGDQAVLMDFGNRIDPALNETILDLFDHLQKNPVQGMTDLVPAYSSLAVFYDPLKIPRNNGKTVFETVVEHINERIRHATSANPRVIRKIKVPFCFAPDYAPDLEEIAATKNLSPEEFIEIFTGVTYRVYMIGFLPGFAYMGEVDDRIATPRKNEPRTKVRAGSVGIAGKQTGIYPVQSPGGWQLVGCTPLLVFTRHSLNPVLFQPGDEVIFYPITENEFKSHQGRNI